MGRIGSIVTGMVILLGGFALGAGAVQAVSIHDETGISVPIDPSLASLAPTPPEPTANPVTPPTEPVPVAPAPPQPTEDDDADDDN